MLPSFLLGGAQKAGTTWLYRSLRDHPLVWMPPQVKEVFYFDRYYERGIRWYERYFDGCPAGLLCGEASATYLAAPEVPARIARVLPHVRLLFSLRNPVDRAYSMYLHLLRKGDTSLSFSEALDAFPSLKSDGLYARHLSRYREHFDPESISVLIYEDLTGDPDYFWAAACRALDLEASQSAGLTRRVNVRRRARSRILARSATSISRRLHRQGLHRVVRFAKAIGTERALFGSTTDRMPSPGQSVIAALKDYYRADVAQLETLIGRDLRGLWLGE